MGRRKLTQEEFISRAKKIHGDTYDYSLVKYINATSKVDIICPKHGTFRQVAHSHILGWGCRYCHYDKVKINFKRYNQIRILKASKSYIKRAQKIHIGRDYDYSLVEYKKGIEKITVICPKHGQFRPTANNHLAGQICPECSESGFNPKKPATLYYFKIKGLVPILYKIGITNRNIEDRYNAPKDREKIEIIKRWDFPIGSKAQAKEKEIKNLYRDFLYQGKSPLLRAGITEIFEQDILGLDKPMQLRLV